MKSTVILLLMVSVIFFAACKESDSNSISLLPADGGNRINELSNISVNDTGALYLILIFILTSLFPSFF